MENRIRPYAWGSRTAIAELLGAPSPSPHPQAELWIGAHPGDPSALVCADGHTENLNAVIEADPVRMLGRAVYDEFGARLPFLLKVLAAAEPLSLQAHPSTQQAERGFDSEERGGIPLGAHWRNYKDRYHKPELICALTQFEALCGFREPSTTVRLLSELQVPALDHYLALLSGQPDAHGMRALFSSIITVPSGVLEPLLDDVLAACVRKVREKSEFGAEYRTALELGERYPGDVGVIASLLMNRITLQPNEAIYLHAGNLHAYLSGVGVEIMASSDNVLRGGLTPKHVDVPELMRVLDFEPGPMPVFDGAADERGIHDYGTPIKEFRLSRLELDGRSFDLRHSGPQVLLVTEGSAKLTAPDGRQLTIARGRSAWIAADEGAIQCTGTGVAFRATDGFVPG
jgi:mannose-6-phosphate isomerase